MLNFRFGIAALGFSLLTAGPVQAQEVNQHAEIAAAETNININANFLHTNYSEGPPDSEHGFTPGFGVGASVLVPSMWTNIDIYSAFNYQFNAGNLTYNGHYLYSGLPVDATDNAVFNRIQARLGLGVPLANSALELIPYVTAGYQSWNRNINNPGVIGTDEFYSSALIGGGMKLDIPVSPTLVFSGNAEMMAMVGNHLSADSLGIGWDMGGSAQERVSLGVDDALWGQVHLQASANYTHFNYAGSKPSAETYGYYEPLSTTNQFGVNLGVAYSF